MVNCNDCGGEIDEETLTCKKCGRKYTKEEYDKLLANSILNILNDNIDEKYSSISSEIDNIEKWIKGEKEDIGKINSELNAEISPESVVNLEEIKRKIDEQTSILEQKTQELSKKLEDTERIRTNLNEIYTKILQKITVIGDLRHAKNIIEKISEYSDRITELLLEINKTKIELSNYKAKLKEISDLLNIKDEDIFTKLKEIIEENRMLKIELESAENRLKMQKEIWQDWISAQSDKVKNLAEYELKLKEQELLLEKQLKELSIREEELKNSSSRNMEVDEIKYQNILEENNLLKNEINRLNNLIEMITQGNEILKKDVDTEKELERLKVENQQLRTQLETLDKALNDLKQTMKFKEEEYSRREQDLLFREKKLQEQMKEMENQRIEIEELKKLEQEHKIEDLSELVKRKEEQLKQKERYLQEIAKELEAKEKGLIDKEISMAQEEIIKEIKEEKVRTGTRRLDDLTYGGFPLGSNILVMGPAYSGKEVLVYSFLAEGVKKGVPVVVILIDKTVELFEEEMNYVLPTWKSYVEKGLVKYIDAYSRTIGEKSNVEGVIYLDSQTDLNGISEAIEKIISEIKGIARYYRLAFFTLSTILTFADSQSVLKFLQPFTTKRKKENAVSLYLLEKGLHEENTIQMVSYLMDGAIDFKSESGKIYLQVRGITEVQSRSWIEISPSKSGIIMGSFTLGHIR